MEVKPGLDTDSTLYPGTTSHGHQEKNGWVWMLYLYSKLAHNNKKNKLCLLIEAWTNTGKVDIEHYDHLYKILGHMKLIHGDTS